MLPNARAVEQVFTDPEKGMLSVKSSKRKFFLECSTIEVAASARVLQAVKTSRLGDFIDAPVSGGIPAADQGTLTFMVGAARDLFNRAKPILALMGKEENIIYCGGPGAGLATKQINNYIANVSFVALSEGISSEKYVAHLTINRNEHRSSFRFGSRDLSKYVLNDFIKPFLTLCRCHQHQ